MHFCSSTHGGGGSAIGVPQLLQFGWRSVEGRLWDPAPSHSDQPHVVNPEAEHEWVQSDSAQAEVRKSSLNVAKKSVYKIEQDSSSNRPTLKSEKKGSTQLLPQLLTQVSEETRLIQYDLIVSPSAGCISCLVVLIIFTGYR